MNPETCKCGKPKNSTATVCADCYWQRSEVEMQPVEQGITPIELINAIISMCEGEIS